jgi:hypothetical protein
LKEAGHRGMAEPGQPFPKHPFAPAWAAGRWPIARAVLPEEAVLRWMPDSKEP